MTTPQQQIVDKCKAIFAKATELYGLNFDNVGIRFDLKGRAAGMACRRGGHMYMRFNRDMLTRDAFDHVINDTVPHEIAHIICFMNPQLGRNHDSGWTRVCRTLGGNGERCHSEEVVFGKGTTYEYTTDRGHTVRMSDKHHAMVQAGRSLRYKSGKGTVTRECAYSIVGVQGRTLAASVVKVPVVAASPVLVFNPAPNPPAPKFGVLATLPVATAPTTPVRTLPAGASKAARSRAIMLSGHTQGMTYEQIIAAMQAACGYDRALARATYKANCAKVGIPV